MSEPLAGSTRLVQLAPRSSTDASTTISDDTYQHLKTALLERVHDKEATVRMQAVVALAKLQEADEPDEDEEEDEDELTVTQVLIDVLTHDPAA